MFLLVYTEILAAWAIIAFKTSLISSLFKRQLILHDIDVLLSAILFSGETDDTITTMQP